MNISSQQSVKRPEWVPGQHGFTLVELLLAVAIIAILSTLSVAMIASAQREARTSATEGRINQIQTILSTYIEDMEFRKMPFRTSDLDNLVVWSGNVPVGGANPDRERYYKTQQVIGQILVDYLNVEMPYQSFDEDSRTWDTCQLGLFPSLSVNPDCSNPAGIVTLLQAPASQSALVRQWYFLRPTQGDFNAGNVLGVEGRVPSSGRIPHLSGELLYQLLDKVDSDGASALESLGNGARGNVDGDNYPEVVDAWGDPLDFALTLRDPETRVEYGFSHKLPWAPNRPSVNEIIDDGTQQEREAILAILEIQNLRMRVWSENVAGRVEF
ncbi:MAG: type II secretion system GspH family protein [Mariniblastus sp.]|nr:type II secretion system GspH family protein [Mariniblastus sp.]